MKKMLVSVALSSSLLFGGDVLTGLPKMACETILCLSSGTRPSECNPPLNYFYSINYRKIKDTIKARRNFLQMCPIGSVSSDKGFTIYRDSLATIRVACTLENLNRVQRKNEEDEEFGWAGLNKNLPIRINPNLLYSCELLSKSVFSNIRPVYTCDKNKWYSSTDWNLGYTKLRISKSEYDKLDKDERVIGRNENIWYSEEGSSSTYYAKKIPINKNCWVFEY